MTYRAFQQGGHVADQEQNAAFLGGWIWAGTVRDVQDKKKTEALSPECVANQMRKIRNGRTVGSCLVCGMCQSQRGALKRSGFSLWQALSQKHRAAEIAK